MTAWTLPQNVIVCGVSGKIGSGKTTLCEYIVRQHGTCLVRNFADRLKEEVAMHLDIDLSLCYSHDGKNTPLPEYGDGMTIGTFLQKWGTMLRELHPDIWINAVQSWLRQQIAARSPDDDDDEKLIVLIGDVRFPNEVAWIKRIGGFVVRLEGDPGGIRARSSRDLAHVSETALDAYTAWDAVLYTDKISIDETGQRVYRALDKA